MMGKPAVPMAPVVVGGMRYIGSGYAVGGGPFGNVLLARSRANRFAFLTSLWLLPPDVPAVWPNNR